MRQYRHLWMQGTEINHDYTATATPRSPAANNPPRDRATHAAALQQQLRDAQAEVEGMATEQPVDRLALEFASDPGYDFLAFESLDLKRHRIELCNVRSVAGQTLATVSVPLGKVDFFIEKIERYATELSRYGKPKECRLIESIGRIRRAAMESFWTGGPVPLPIDTQCVWWEVWIRASAEPTVEALLNRVGQLAEDAGLRLGDGWVAFPERLVLLAYGSIQHWTSSLALMNLLAELRPVKEVATPFLNLRPHEQVEYIAELLTRVQPPPATAPAVCLLDTGVRRGHPLLALALDAADVHAANPDWAVVGGPHGTQMAGIALYGPDLAKLLLESIPVTLHHRLESVRLLPTPPTVNDPQLYGWVTQQAVARAVLANPSRLRVNCLAVTSDDHDRGYPSSWSAFIDQHSADVDEAARQLYVVSAGNIRDLIQDPSYCYPQSCHERTIQDPAQAWNALTVGAYTDLGLVRSSEYHGLRPVAEPGSLCPSSRTSIGWPDDTWPLKPDVVLEGGNYAYDGQGNLSRCDDLALLTTHVDGITGQQLCWMQDTSAATAQAARMAAVLLAQYPNLWPETVRGLLVHAAEWTPTMRGEHPAGDRRSVHQLLRSYGYGVPRLDRALWSLQNQVTLIFQGELQPFQRVGSNASTKHYHLHALPWPRQVLEDLRELDVTVRITLSYFIEPSPGGRGWGRKHRYASHGLRFKLRGPTESDTAFQQRISRSAWDEDGGHDRLGEPQQWAIGPQLRTRGSVHSDWWTASAANVAACDQLAVYPVSGWWRERAHLERCDSRARYSLIISLETDPADVELYTAIENLVGVSTEIAL